MSVRVGLEDLGKRIDQYGPLAFVITVGAAGGPHVVSAMVAFDGADVRAPAGNTTSANVEAQPHVTLLWPQWAEEHYCLIVDGSARVDDGHVVVTPERAVLHRVAGAPADLPSCVTVIDRERL